MIFAIIENGIVVNRAVSDTPAAGNWIEAGTAQIGWSYDNGIFTPPAPVPDPVPESISKRQAKQQLLLSGMLTLVQPAINAIVDDTERGLMQIYWDDSQDFYREHPSLIAMAQGALSLTDAQIDALFLAAAEL